MYFGFILIVLGLALISQHWLSIASGVLGSLLFYSDLGTEEQSNVEKFGVEYESYMTKVPRMNIFLGIIRRIMERRREFELMIFLDIMRRAFDKLSE